MPPLDIGTVTMLLVVVLYGSQPERLRERLSTSSCKRSTDAPST